MGDVAKHVRSGLVVAIAGAAITVGSTLPASAETTHPTIGSVQPATTGARPDAAAVARARVYKNVWHTAPSYYSGFGGRTGGYLFAGTNYFYCQGTGWEINALGYHNNWWLLTDDDSRHSNVWVNAIYVSGGGNDQPIPGVPRC